MSHQAASVALLDPNTRIRLSRGRILARMPVSDCIWPMGCPDHLLGKRMSDLGPEDHLISFGRTLSARWPTPGIRAKVSIVLAEPCVIQDRFQKRVVRHAQRFHRVLSYNPDVLARIANGLFFPYGTTWVPDWQSRDLTKTKMCSLIASAKRSQHGHRLRHQVAEWAQQSGLCVDLLGRGYTSFEDKADGLASYRYSVVIENTQETNYFTEKVIDAVLCDTVPIYWGCPNLNDFMDTSGMIICNSFEDIQSAVNAMSEADYTHRLTALKRAVPDAHRYADIFTRAAQAVLSDRPVP